MLQPGAFSSSVFHGVSRAIQESTVTMPICYRIKSTGGCYVTVDPQGFVLHISVPSPNSASAEGCEFNILTCIECSFGIGAGLSSWAQGGLAHT